MGNMLLAYGNRADNAELRGGVAFPSMPLSNLQNRQLGVLWRSVDAQAASTVINITMMEQDKVRVLALANHNLGLTAQYRLRASNDPTFTTRPAVVAQAGAPIGISLLITGSAISIPAIEDIYDSGWVDVWPAVYATEDLEWEDNNFWDGRYAEEDLAGYMRTLCILLPQTIRPTYWRLELVDEGNVDGFIQAGRLFMAPSWQPIYNASFGATLGWQDDTDVQVAISGAEFYDEKIPYRIAQFKFDTMTENEGLANPFEIMRKSGIHKEVLFMWDPEDTVHATRRQFLGRLRTLSPLEFPDGFLNGNSSNGSFRSSVPMEVKELVS